MATSENLLISSELQESLQTLVSLVSGIGSLKDQFSFWPEELYNWIVCSVCLHHHIAPVLREEVKRTFEKLYNKLRTNNNINNQLYPNVFEFNNYNYQNINNNQRHGKKKEKFDYCINNAVDLSKVFLHDFLTHYQDFDGCDLSALLNAIIRCSDFTKAFRKSAIQVRDELRNKWAHYKKSDWSNSELYKYWHLTEDLVKHLSSEEVKNRTLEQIKNLRDEGQRVLRGTADDLDQVMLILHGVQETCKNLQRLLPTPVKATQGRYFCAVCKEQFQPANIWRRNAPVTLENEMVNDQEKNRLSAHLVKLYPWLKDEMQIAEVLCIASKLLIKSDEETRGEIESCMGRRSAVAKLLKFVLRKNCYIQKFFSILNEHWSPTDLMDDMMRRNEPNDNEIKEYIGLFEPRENTSYEELKFKEGDAGIFEFRIADYYTIDKLNDVFLSKFLFKLREHECICGHLDRNDYQSAVSYLLTTMNKCNVNIMEHYLETLKKLNILDQDGYEKLAKKYLLCDARKTSPEERTMSKQSPRHDSWNTLWSWNTLRVILQNLTNLGLEVVRRELGSLILHLRSNRHDMSDIAITDVINTTCSHTYDPDFCQFEVQMILYENMLEENEAERTTVLKLDITDQCTPEKSVFDTRIDPVKYNMQLLSEELEINDHFVSYLQTADVLPYNISKSLTAQKNRLSKVKHVLEHLVPQNEGYIQIKNYVMHTNTYLYNTLIGREDFIKSLKVVFLFRGPLFKGERMITDVTSLGDTKTAINIKSVEKAKADDEKEGIASKFTQTVSLQSNHDMDDKPGTSQDFFDSYCNVCVNIKNLNVEPEGYCYDCCRYLCKDCLSVHNSLPASSGHLTSTSEGIRPSHTYVQAMSPDSPTELSQASAAGHQPSGNTREIKVQKCSEYDITMGEDKMNCWIIGLSITPGGRRLVADCNNSKIKMFSRDMKIISSLSLPAPPSAITVTGDKGAVVSADKKLFMLDVSDKHMSIRQTVALPFVVHGIVTYKDKLVVTSPYTSPASVKLIDHNGKVYWSTSTDQQGHEMFSSPLYVTFYDEKISSTVIVTDWDNHTLTRLNSDTGEVICRLEVEGKWPRDVTTDISGNIYVCYPQTKEVAVLANDLSEIKMLLTECDGISGEPRAIVYDAEDHQLLLAYWTRNVIGCFQLQ